MYLRGRKVFECPQGSVQAEKRLYRSIYSKEDDYMRKQITAAGVIIAVLTAVVSFACGSVPAEETMPEEETAQTQEQSTEAAAAVQTEQKIPLYHPGELYSFGSYEQDGDDTNGQEPIEWVILEVSEDSLLLMSRDAIECLPYEEDGTDTTYETCSLRAWLNDAFCAAALTDEEQALLRTESLVNADNPQFGTEGGNDTEDLVFLLSAEEAQACFTMEELSSYSVCHPSTYVRNKGAWSFPESEDTVSVWWWLRSPGKDSRYAAGVGHTGIIGTYGTRTDQAICAVRPVIRIEAETMEIVKEPETEPETEPEEETQIPEDSSKLQALADTLTPLQPGMQGEEVRALQSQLIELGLLQDNADGDYGPKTEAAVRAFQQEQGLEETGMADGMTRAMIQTALEP